MSDRVTVKKGTISVLVVRDDLDHWKSLGYVEDKPKRAARPRRKPEEGDG